MPDPATTPAHEGGEREMDINKVSELERDLEIEIASILEYVPDDASLCKAMIALRNGIAALAGTSADAGARETVTVYVLNRAYDYKGECTIGVFATKEAAVAGARANAVDYGRDDSPLVEIPGGSWAVNEGDSTQWVIRDFEVQGVTVTPGKERGT